VIGALERLTAVALWLVVTALIWIVLASYWPEVARTGSEQAEVVAVLVLVTVTLFLVSLLALLHTRRQ
jgi:hypothetical protein